MRNIYHEQGRIFVVIASKIILLLQHVLTDTPEISLIKHKILCYARYTIAFLRFSKMISVTYFTHLPLFKDKEQESRTLDYLPLTRILNHVCLGQRTASLAPRLLLLTTFLSEVGE